MHCSVFSLVVLKSCIQNNALHISTKTVTTQFQVDDSFLSSTNQANPVSDSSYFTRLLNSVVPKE